MPHRHISEVDFDDLPRVLANFSLFPPLHPCSHTPNSLFLSDKPTYRILLLVHDVRTSLLTSKLDVARGWAVATLRPCLQRPFQVITATFSPAGMPKFIQNPPICKPSPIVSDGQLFSATNSPPNKNLRRTDIQILLEVYTTRCTDLYGFQSNHS